MSEQAEKTNDEVIEIIEDLNTGEEKPVEEPEEVEIFLEGEEPATSKPVPKGFLKRINKLNSKVAEANEHASESDRRVKMLEEEAKLLRLKLQQEPAQKKPSADDFNSDAEFEKAVAQYDEERINQIAEKRVNERLAQSQTETTQAQADTNLQKDLASHYDRAEALKVSDYADTEDKAIDVLGNDIVKQIMANTDKSHLIMYHLGKNPAKAERLASLIKSNPMKGVLEIGRLESQIQTRAKSSQAADPETNLEGGKGGGSDWERKLEKKREQVSSGKASMKDLIALKKQAKAAGVNL